MKYFVYLNGGYKNPDKGVLAHFDTRWEAESFLEDVMSGKEEKYKDFKKAEIIFGDSMDFEKKKSSVSVKIKEVYVEPPKEVAEKAQE